MAQKLIPFSYATTTKHGGSHSGYSAMNPVFFHLINIATAKEGLKFVNEGLHKLIGGVLKQYGKRKHDEIGEENARELGKLENMQRELFRDESSPVEIISNELHPGTIFTAGYVDTRNEHKRVAHRDSPSRYKK